MVAFELRMPADDRVHAELLFRPYRPEDAEALYQAARESAGEGFSEWMPWCHADYSPEESRSYAHSRPAAWERGEDYSLAVFDPHTGDLVAGCGLNQLSHEHGFANLGYWVRRSRWGRGIAVGCIRAASRLAFEQLGLGRVEIVVAVGNESSRRAAEKSGAWYEGVLRNRLVLHGARHDAWMFSHIPQ